MVRLFANKKKTMRSGRKFRSPKVFATRPEPPKRNLRFKLPNLKYAVIIIFIVLISYYLFFSSIFKIKEYVVEGNEAVSKDDIVNTISSSRNIFLFNSDQAKQTLLVKFNEIKAVEIYRGIPDTIKIVILEREGKIIWQSGDKKFLISVEGDVAKQISDQNNYSNLPLVVDSKSLPVNLGDQLVSENFVAFVTNVYSTFYAETGLQPQNFEVGETTFDVNLKTDAGFYVKFNSLRSSQKQLDNLKLVLSQKRQDIHEYIDLRIDGWAYYK